MNLVISAGGAGLRTLEALIQLLSVGIGPDRVSLLSVDPDGSNGNGTRTSSLIEKYQRLHQKLRGDAGLARLGLFQSQLELFDYPGSSSGLKNWSPVHGKETLGRLLRVESLSGTETPREVVDLFFTPEELALELDQGFRGHTAIGAAVFSRIEQDKNEAIWRQVADRIKTGVSQGLVNVVLIGSVFGGTGASAIHPLARFLKQIPEANKERLRIGVVALVPYFNFISRDGKNPLLAAKAEGFALATKAAADFYFHLREVGDWPFDTMLWVGDSSPSEVEYAPGGPNQSNPAHSAELIAALGVADFLLQREGDLFGSLYYAGPGKDPGNGSVEWSTLPLKHLNLKDVQSRLLTSLLVGAMHNGFFLPALLDQRFHREPWVLPWYWDRFVAQNQSLFERETKEALVAVSEYYRHYCFPWWKAVGDRSCVRLVNPAAFRETSPGSVDIELSRLGNLLWERSLTVGNLLEIDEFVGLAAQVQKDEGAGQGLAGYLGILGSAARKYIHQNYKLTN